LAALAVAIIAFGPGSLEPLLRFILDIRYWQRIQRVAYAGTTNGV
jgi:hypothetical protein